MGLSQSFYSILHSVIEVLYSAVSTQLPLYDSAFIAQALGESSPPTNVLYTCNSQVWDILYPAKVR